MLISPSFEAHSDHLVRGSSLTLPSLPTIHDSIYPDLTSSSFTAISETATSLMWSSMKARHRLTFFDLPLEVRNQVYHEALGPSTSIHIRQVHGGNRIHFLFLKCSTSVRVNGTCKECAYTNLSDLKPTHNVYDMTLLLVSPQVRAEGSTIIFSKNHFVFFLDAFLEHFIISSPQDAKLIQSVSMTAIMDDAGGRRHWCVAANRRLCRGLPALKRLEIHLKLHSSTPTSMPIFEEGILNFFRPFSRLHLSQAMVVVNTLYQDKRLTEAKLQDLCAKARSILLLDPTLPEQESQVQSPEVLAKTASLKQEPEPQEEVSTLRHQIAMSY